MTQALGTMIAQEEQDRLRRFEAAWKAYDGEMKPPMKVLDGIDDNVIIPSPQVIVDKGISFLCSPDQGKMIGFDVDVADGDKGTAAQQFLDATWRANRQGTLLHELAMNGGVTGHVFFKILPPDPSKGREFPRLINLDPANVFPVWSAHDVRETVSWRIQYTATDPVTGKPRSYRQRIEPSGARWTIIDEESAPDSPGWQIVAEQEWAFSWAPIVGAQNLIISNEYWGRSDIEASTLQLCGALNFLLSNLTRIVRLHAHPHLWGRGFDAADALLGPDDLFVIPSEHGVLDQVVPSADLSQALELYRAVKDVLHEVTRIPEVATGKVGNLGQLSGLALKILYGPLVEKTGTKRLTYGDLLGDVNAHLLELGGHDPAREVHIQWPDMLPDDPGAEGAVLLVDQQLGVSKATLLERRGYDPAQEAEKSAQEGESVGAVALNQFDRGVGQK